jgi:hypothetical protein
MKRTFLRALLWVSIGFAVLFTLRLIYGYVYYPDSQPGQQMIQSQAAPWSARLAISNYASKKMAFKTSQKARRTTTVDQKYEKIGTLSSKTREFESDEKALKGLVKKYDMLTQFEQRFGLKGKRVLRTAFGVLPERFDKAIADIKTIGKLVSIQIIKKDKTNEYKGLEAKKVSLVKARESLIALKTREGKIKELTALEDRILAIEEKIQSLGVKLGEYDEENEFCTVKFTLNEVSAAKAIPFLHRAKVAFEWTVKYYAVIMVICFFGGLFGLMIVTIVRQIKWLQKAIAQMAADLQ